MRVLVAWDDPEETELLSLYLNIDGVSAAICTDPSSIRESLNGHGWDAIILPTDRPDHETALATFRLVRELLPDCPVLGACHPGAMYRLAGFLSNGLRGYVIRDEARDFMFLLQSALLSTAEGVRAERERLVSAKLREEIESVRRLQESIIPRELYSPPGYLICGRYEASELRVIGGQPVILAGGDYFDVFASGAGQTFVLLGDAAGHGMKACMSIMIMHTLVQMIRDRRYEDPAAFVSEVNRHLCDQAVIRDSEGFITLLFGRVDATTHEFEWTSAGHPQPLLHRRDTNTVEPLASRRDGGMALGIDADAEYTSMRAPIPEGGRVVLYTDGLEEAFPSERSECRQFGLDGITRALTTGRNDPLANVLHSLFHDSNAHTEGSGRHDDTTAVLIERQTID